MKKIIRIFYSFIQRCRLTLSRATPLSLPDRSTSGEIVYRENQVSIYSGLENGNLAVTTLENDQVHMKEIELDHLSPVSSISVDSLSDSVIQQTMYSLVDIRRL